MKMHMQKWGNSLALRIPKSIAVKAGIKQGNLVDISLKNGNLIVRPVNKPEITLEQLLARVSDENLHHEVDTNPITGDEIW
jgi:antitoxin MazE